MHVTPAPTVIWYGIQHKVAWSQRPNGGHWVRNWFSNMQCRVPITWRENTFQTVEHAYQAAKFNNPARIHEIKNAKFPAQAKLIAKKWKTETVDWPQARVAIMWLLLLQKWTASPHREELLLNPDPIVEFNNWGDAFWGVVIRETGEVVGGQDTLGKMLSSIRQQLRQDPNCPVRLPNDLLPQEQLKLS